MNPLFPCILLLVAFAGTGVAWSASVRSEAPPVGSLRITVLSTMLAGELNKGIGEWGFAALVEVDGRRLLFDTGQRPSTVHHNARELGIDLSDVDDLILSHHHGDHIGGLLTLRRAFVQESPAALCRTHLAVGAFVSRGPGHYAGDDNPLIALRSAYEATGGIFIEHGGPVELQAGVWFTGPIPRKHPDEQPIPRGWVRHAPDGSLIPDEVPEDAALVFDTKRGLVVLMGCGHAGLINTLEYARRITSRPDAPVYAITGGFHLLQTSDDALDWTASKLKEFGVRHLHGGHCTGLEAVYRLRDRLRLPREAASVAAVGSWFDLDGGLHPLILAR